MKTCPDTLSNLFFLQIPKKDISITNTLSNLFFLQITSKRHVQYIHFVRSFFFCKWRTKTRASQTHFQIFFCKSRKKTCPLQRHCQTFFLQIAKEDMSITKTLSNLFFAIHEQRHVQYIHFVKSFFFVNHELKDMSITNLKTDQERKTLGMILSTIRNVERLWSWCVSYLRKQRNSTFHQIWEQQQQQQEEEEEEECTKKQYQQGRWHDTLLHADLQWQHSRNPLQLLLTLADEYLLLHKVPLVVVQLPWLVQEKCLLKLVLLLVVLLLLFCRPSQELVAQAEEALLMMVEKESSVSVAHNTATHTYLLPTHTYQNPLNCLLFCFVALFYFVFLHKTKPKKGFFLISSRRITPRFWIFNKEEEETTCRFLHY